MVDLTPLSTDPIPFYSWPEDWLDKDYDSVAQGIGSTSIRWDEEAKAPNAAGTLGALRK